MALQPRFLALCGLFLIINLPLSAQNTMTSMSLPPATSFSATAINQARQTVRELKIRSEVLGRDVNLNLLLPANYEQSGLRYPVLYLLHGSYDNHKAWNEKTGAAALLSTLPLIVVMPDAGMTRYINSPGLGRYKDFFLQELVPHIDKNYRSIAQREGRALCGLSMGGYGAWRLGLDAPKTFVATAALSGSFAWGEAPFENERYFERAKQIYGGDGAGQRQMFVGDRIWPHVEKNLIEAKWQGPALYFSIGTEDFLRPANLVLRGRLEEKKIPFIYAENPGAHEWIYWDTHLRDALSFLMLHLAAPQK
jgi:enterochelin esterase-like enzyme